MEFKHTQKKKKHRKIKKDIKRKTLIKMLVNRLINKIAIVTYYSIIFVCSPQIKKKSN